MAKMGMTPTKGGFSMDKNSKNSQTSGTDKSKKNEFGSGQQTNQ
jgi:hypothetical protein